jgi:hypothetical protein
MKYLFYLAGKRWLSKNRDLPESDQERQHENEAQVGRMLKRQLPNVCSPEDEDKANSPQRGAPDRAYPSPYTGQMIGVEAKLHGAKHDWLERDDYITAESLAYQEDRIVTSESYLKSYQAEKERCEGFPDMQRHLEQQISRMENNLAMDKRNVERVKAGFIDKTSGSGGVVSCSLNGLQDYWRVQMASYTGQIVGKWRANGSWVGPVVIAVRDVSMESFAEHDAQLIHTILPEFPDITGVLHSKDWETGPVRWIPNPHARFGEDISQYLDV